MTLLPPTPEGVAIAALDDILDRPVNLDRNFTVSLTHLDMVDAALDIVGALRSHGMLVEHRDTVACPE